MLLFLLASIPVKLVSDERLSVKMFSMEIFSSSVIWESCCIGWHCSVGWIGRTDAVGFDVLGVVRQIGAFSMVSSSSTPRYPTEISSGIVLLII